MSDAERRLQEAQDRRDELLAEFQALGARRHELERPLLERARLERILSAPDDFPDVDLAEIRARLPAARGLAANVEAAQEELKDKERRVHDELGEQAALVKRCKKEVRKENAAEVAEAQEVEMQRALDDAQYRATPQDSLDRLLDLVRSHNAQGRRNRWILVASIASMLAARTIWKLYLSDVDAPALVFGGSQDWKLAALVWPVAWIPIVALAHWRSHALTIIGGALIAPLAVAAVAYGMRDDRRWQHEARQVFARYTHRFPTGRLHAVAIRSQYQSVIDICAQEGPDPNPNRDFDEQLFCLDMVLNRPKGKEVFGGWRQRADAAGPEDGGFDCFGDVRVENNC